MTALLKLFKLLQKGLDSFWEINAKLVIENLFLAILVNALCTIAVLGLIAGLVLWLLT
ncbi:MAG: hypothetical protein OXG25_07685 [Gammaproteobacteria bacterium]|nr:hypothetical protein [Gammaproteobacteria bacterium]